jgi:hypothetical protein
MVSTKVDLHLTIGNQTTLAMRNFTGHIFDDDPWVAGFNAGLFAALKDSQPQM